MSGSHPQKRPSYAIDFEISSSGSDSLFKTLHALRSDLARERRVDHAKSIGEQRGGTTWSRRAGTAEERESASNADRGGRGVEEKEDSGNDPNGEQSFALCPQPNPAAGWRRGGRGTPTLFCSTSPSARAAGVGPCFGSRFGEGEGLPNRTRGRAARTVWAAR